MKRRVAVDREEEGVLILVDEKENKYEVKKEDVGDCFFEGDVCTAKIERGGKVLKLTRDPVGTDIKKREMKSRLSRLFDKNK